MDNPNPKGYGMINNTNDNSIDNNNNTPTKESKTKIHKTMNSDEKKPFFLMTLEDNMGKCKQIKIFQNTNPSELAYNFCKENNLDFSSMKYIKSNIKTIVKQFNESKQKSIYSNNIIKEEENEDDYLSENTLKNNEKKTQDNDEENNSKNLPITEKDADSSLSPITTSRGKDDPVDKTTEDNIQDIQEKSNNEETPNINNNENENDNDMFFTDKNIERVITENKSEKKRPKNDKFLFDNDDENFDINNKYKNSKSLKLNDKDFSNNKDSNSHIKLINNIGKIPIKINQISPKQIEINENIQKIINNGSKSTKDNDNTYNIINNNNYLSSVEKNKNNAYLSIFDKELKDNKKNLINSLDNNNKRTEISLPINSCHQLSDIIYSKNKKEDENKEGDNINKETDTIQNNITENNKDDKDDLNCSNHSLNHFGENYIKKYTKTENDNYNDISKKVSQSVDSIENGVPVLNNDMDLEDDDENSFINDNVRIQEIGNNCENKEINNNNHINHTNTNDIDNANNKGLLLNKMKKYDFNLSKKKNKNKEINRLLDLIKNSYYNINKNMKNKIIKDKTNNLETIDANKIKTKNSNSLDINYEISRNLENESINLYAKMINNNNILNSLKNNNFINTNFNAYIENNKINNKINNNYNNINTSKNKSHQNNKKPLNKKNFFSNPNLSSNQEAINASNDIYNIIHDFKNFIKKEKGLNFKSKTLSKDKDKNKDKEKEKDKIQDKDKDKNQEKKQEKTKKTSSYSKKKKLSKKYTGNITTRRRQIKDNNKKQYINFKTKITLNKKNISTPNTIETKKSNYLKLKSCQTPPTKRLKNTDRKLTILCDWLTSTINKDSRNVYTTRDHYYKKKKRINKTGKSVTELTIDKGKKADLNILLSKSNYKKIKPNCIPKNIKLDMKNKLIKEGNNKTKKTSNLNYLNPLKAIAMQDTRRNNYLIKNTLNTNKNNNTNNCKILTRINKTLSKKQIRGIKNYNIINTINDYNFNNN